MSAVGRGGGYVRGRVIVLKPLLTALSIGAGAPLGMEGPVVQTGAALGSLAGRRSKMGVANIRILVAAGAAAGLAAKYGAPIGGAVFSAELILGSASTAALLPLITASFLAVATRDALFRGAPEYVISLAPPAGVVDYLMFVVLGVGCGLAAAYFIKIIFATERAVSRVAPAWWARALLAGLAIGAVGSGLPEMLGTGKPLIQALLERPALPVRLLVLFVLLKPLLTSTALGGKASGGIFAPSLFVGAAMGSLVALLAAGPVGIDAEASSMFVLAGMAGVMGAVMRAPLQAVLVTFELTHSYAAVPPLMITVVVSLKTAELLEPESAFTRSLVQAGERLRRGMDWSLLSGLTVRDVMEEDYVALPAEASIGELGEQVKASENRTFPVVDRRGRLQGIVMLASLIAARARAADSDGVEPRVADLLEPSVVYLETDHSLEESWQIMGNYDYDCLPVCRPAEDGPEVIGICEREAIVEMHDRQAFIQLGRRQGGAKQ
jgi:CIC family chloride channel protein